MRARFATLFLCLASAGGVVLAQEPVEAPAAGKPAPAAEKPPAAAPQAAAPATTAPPAAAPRPGRSGRVMDRLELDPTQITGNRELPKVLYIVPWRRSDLGDLLGRPLNSLLDEVLAPVDRDVFRRQNRYYEALRPDAVRPGADSTGGAGAATSEPSASPARDER